MVFMARHTDKSKEEVGVRELHDRTSHYVQKAVAGCEIVVTYRGLPVARLTPITEHDPFEELRQRGLVREPTREWTPSQRNRPRSRGAVSDLVSE